MGTFTINSSDSFLPLELKYDALVGNQACITGNVVTVYVLFSEIGAQDLTLVTKLYSDATGQTPAVSGYYADSTVYKFWNNATETLGEAVVCE